MSFWSTRSWWAQTFERMVKTFAQVLLASLTMQQTGLLEFGWLGALSTAGVAMVVSLLTSIVSTPIGPKDNNPSLV